MPAKPCARGCVFSSVKKNEINALRNQLSTGLAQAKAGELAKGSGEDAIRRVFAAAREKA